ncbi:restriction endonuclease subunit S [Bacillus stratosphericus]|uniref:restriction endonuclease subunit S n=1 Tax=Bacillus stratosphericus TaxID=293386 RepID=UPI001CFA4D08|nr:restriction endonuclease subunit S [Bacillus stratosphericus]
MPEVRFKGFSGEWEESILGEIVQITMGQSPKGENYTKNPHHHILVQGNADMKNGWVTPRLWTTQITKKAKKGDIILSVRAPVGDVGKTHYDVVIGRGVAAIKGNEFIYQLLLKMKVDDFWVKFSTGSTFESINSTDIKAAIIRVPDELEQSRIGNFFKQLDETIALQQQELDTLKQMKQGFLQKMFPKEGESVPEIRFPGFVERWEAKCLGEISESYSGGTPSVDNKTFYGGNIPFIRSAEINSKTTELYITEEGFNNSSSKMVSVGDILYALYGATSGEVGISKVNGAINQALLAIKPKRGYDSYFITQWLKKQKSSIVNTYLQGGQGNLSGSIVKKLILQIPSDEEQTQIGNFFKQLDKTIALHEQELDILKQTKKAFLQKMFV